MGWQVTMTKQGLGILAGLGGRDIVISAWAGEGTVPSEALQDQTALVNAKRELAVIEDGQFDNKRILRLQVTNNGVISDDGTEIVTEKFTLNQLGIFVSVNGGAPILYFIAQNPDGDDIPSNASVKGFIAEYITTVVFSIGDNAAPNDTPPGFITPDALDARLAYFRAQLESEFSLSSNTIVSDEQPTAPCELWLKPMGGATISDALGGGTAAINLQGVYVGDEPPSDTSKLWVQKLT